MTKRGRGQLEADVKQITDAYVMGEFKTFDDRPLSAYRIATAIKERDGLAELPSVGGIVYVLDRWERIGFATFTRNPFAFEDYTEDGRVLGLAALGQRDRDERRRRRAAAKEAEAEAEAEREPEGEFAPEATPLTPEVIEESPVGTDAPSADSEADRDDAPQQLV